MRCWRIIFTQRSVILLSERHASGNGVHGRLLTKHASLRLASVLTALRVEQVHFQPFLPQRSLLSTTKQTMGMAYLGSKRTIQSISWNTFRLATTSPFPRRTLSASSIPRVLPSSADTRMTPAVGVNIDLPRMRDLWLDSRSVTYSSGASTIAPSTLTYG